MRKRIGDFDLPSLFNMSESISGMIQLTEGDLSAEGDFLCMSRSITDPMNEWTLMEKIPRSNPGSLSKAHVWLSNRIESSISPVDISVDWEPYRCKDNSGNSYAVQLIEPGKWEDIVGEKVIHYFQDDL